MVHHEVGFKLQRESPVNEFSQRYSEATLSIWCNHERDVLEVSYDGLTGDSVFREDLKKLVAKVGGKPIRKTLSQDHAQFVVACQSAKAKYSTSVAIEKNNCLLLQPVVYSRGWEWYRVIALSPKDLRRMFESLDKACTVEIYSRSAVDEGSMQDTLVISTSDLFHELSAKQAQALMLALDEGYYRVPKRATTGAIASRVSLPRTTFEEHLRKAESKVMLSVAPYIQFTEKTRKRNRPNPDGDGAA